MKIFKNFAILSVFLIQTVLSGPHWYVAKDGTRFLVEIAYKYNWFQASHECARRDAQLVAIDTEEKNNQIQQVLRDASIANHNLWIGANDAYSERHDNLRPFYWSATGQEFSFTFWADSQPDNLLYKEHCVHIMRYSYPLYGWNDNSCSNTDMGYICEERVAGESQQKDSDTDNTYVMEKTENLEDGLYVSDKIHKLRATRPIESVPIHEELGEGAESVKQMKIDSENIRKWKDIVRSSIRKTELDIIGSLFKFNMAVFKEPQDEE